MGKETSFCWFDKYITTLQLSWNHFDKCAVEKLSCATKNCGCCGRTKLSYSGISLVHVLRKGYFGQLRDHFGQRAVEELLWATQESVWRMRCGRTTLGNSGITLAVRCGRATLSYSGITLGSVLWKGYFGLLRDHFGQCAVEELLWATQGSLWGVCCGSTTLGYSGITLASLLWKIYFGLLRDHFGQCAVEDHFGQCVGLLRDHFGQCAGLLRDHFGRCAVEELSWRAKLGYRTYWSPKF